MAVTRLTNAGWGFASMCFVCEEANALGMRVPFFHDDERGVVTAEFTLTDTFSGAPELAHGGALMALCDEAMSWATIAVAKSFALTASNGHRFLRPVRLGRPYVVEARIVERTDVIRTAAVITSRSTGKVAVEADAVFTPLDAARAADVIGQEITGTDADYVT
jgi:acyl-coenzyme A thioesterase PaaI-like protein